MAMQKDRGRMRLRHQSIAPLCGQLLASFLLIFYGTRKRGNLSQPRGTWPVGVRRNVDFIIPPPPPSAFQAVLDPSFIIARGLLSVVRLLFVLIG